MQRRSIARAATIVGSAYIVSNLAGFLALHAGQEYDQELDGEGEPWAAELSRRYQEVADRYTEQWGAKLMEREWR